MDLARRLLRGQHLVLWGTRDSGRTTVLNDVWQLHQQKRWGFSVEKAHQDDITCALERVYGHVITQRLSRQAARGRLWGAADAEPGMRLPDQVSNVSI